MLKRTLLFIPALSLAALSGCMTTTPQLDDQYGDSIALLKAQQTLNPNAPADNEGRPVTGFEGRAARETMDRYYKSFSEPVQQTGVLNINVGSGNAPSGGQ